MKFIKHPLKQRASRCSTTKDQQQNKPPVNLQQCSKQNPVPSICSMEDQAMEPERKQEHLYLEQILEYLANLPHDNATDPQYFKIQSDITPHMRSMLLNWLVDVHLKYKLQPKTLFITVHIIDKYLSQVSVKRTHLQLVGIVALWIASKYEETYQVPKVNNLIFICDSTYTKQQILEMETEIIQVINFNLMLNTQLHYFQALQEISKFNSKDFFLCRYILELCLFEVQFKKYHPKLIACATAYFVRKLRKNHTCWFEKQQQLFHVSEAQIKQCARQICMFWGRADGADTLNSLKNKFQSVNYKEVSKIKIGQATKAEPRTQLRA